MTSALTTTDMSGLDVLHRVELSDHERGVVVALADELVRTCPSLVDDPTWLRHARQLSCSLPARLLTAIRQYRHDSGVDGTLSVANLPVAEGALPPTPDVQDSVERAATVPAATAMLLALQLGEVIAYRDEKHGALVQNVVPIRSLERSQSNGGSVPLEFHTENAFHPNRPDYIGLLCLRGAREEVGTLVSAVRRALPLIDESDLAKLRTPHFITSPPPSFHAGGRTIPHPIIEGSETDPNLRVDFNATAPVDDEAAGALDRLRDAMMDVRATLILRPGQMVFIDNRVNVHGRGPFTPRYDGTDRWLHRVFVHLDNRRSRGHRPGNGSVLT